MHPSPARCIIVGQGHMRQYGTSQTAHTQTAAVARRRVVTERTVSQRQRTVIDIERPAVNNRTIAVKIAPLDRQAGCPAEDRATIPTAGGEERAAVNLCRACGVD